MDVPIPADLPRLPPRRADSHKGDYGRALLVGGSVGMSGAIALAGMSCLRSGAGLVKLAVPFDCQESVAGFSPCYMTAPLGTDLDGELDDESLEEIDELAADATCLAIGPGLGRGVEFRRLLKSLYRKLKIPMVIDADGLNALAASKNGLARPGGPRVLTPHPGEFARLAESHGLSTDGDQRAQAVTLAARHEIIIVLKGHRTLITDGHTQHVNTTGNPGMATGGTGDVLTGIITALICQQLAPLDAARLGVFVHGLAGDLAAEHIGQTALIATDLIDHLPQAWQTFA